jgi:pyruvate/2-oxoglutarate dehydrogenase complex dihydrolipoamide dehydrogenase (E3) component
LIIGGGQAGPPLAFALAKHGRKVALVEEYRLGGSCVNFGCTPTKAAVASAKLAARAKRGAEFGLHIPEVTVNFGEVIAQAHAVAEHSRLGLEDWFASAEGNPTLLRGHARLAGRSDVPEHDGFLVEIEGATHTASIVVLNTGTRSRMPPIEGLSECQPLTSENWIAQPELPKRLAMIGGGIASMELALFYQRMGSQVTVVEHSPQVLPTEDEDVAALIRGCLEEEGVTFQTGLTLMKVDKTPEGLVLSCDGESSSCHVEADSVFYSIGRTPNTDDLGLDTVGVAVDERGLVQVNGHLQTTVEGIYACGDIRGGLQLTSTSWDDNRVVESHLIGDGSHTTKRIVPYGVYTDPQIGHVGLHEKELKKAGTEYQLLRFDMSNNGLAREERETVGFIKVMVDPTSQQVLGATVVSATGAEMVHAYAQLMVTGLPVGVIRDAVMGHPTYAEAIQSAVTP